MVCKAKLKLKDSSVQLLSERLKKTGDDEQVPCLIVCYFLGCLYKLLGKIRERM